MKDVLPVGTSFYKKTVEKLEEGYELEFRHEPMFVGKKEYPNCIKVYHFDEQVCSLAESELTESPQQTVLRAIKAGRDVTGQVTEMIVPEATDKFKLTFKMEIDLGTTVFMESFNEDVIVEFDEGDHSYMFEGNTLLSGSKYAEDDSFDAEKTAGYCAKSYGMNASDIMSMWESNADVSRDFGTVVHAMLEHFNRYSKLLSIDKIEKAKPRHPFLRKILNDYIDTVGMKKIEPEVFVTLVEEGFCGQIDCLEITGDKKCNLWDYKINALKSDRDPEGREKLAKYQKQLSFYANVLEKTGWEVGEIGAIVLEENWRVYPFEKLKI